VADGAPAGGGPPTELLRALAVLAEPPTPRHVSLAETLSLRGAPDASTYADVFLFQLYPYASVHLGPEGMLGGEASARIAGFWRAVGRTPPAEPDHLAALLGLYAALGEELHRGSPAERLLVGASREALLAEHLLPWLFAYLERVRELAPAPYEEWAGMLADVLFAEAAGVGPEARGRMPTHFSAAPELEDPRGSGADAFLSALLAPVRSGLILTRADLALIARKGELGLRAGERRYALEHLLAQDATAVLRALAEEAERQASGHRRRIDRVGASARFLAERAEAAARLLRGLADDGAGSGRQPDGWSRGGGAKAAAEQ